ncbi:MAG: hypothetical protein PHE55_08390 [Methylococcaceae bacterium]|nr:hypothetical protein [Methylococcaceae bacterium]
MAVAYKTLFSVEIFHDYFADRQCRVLALSPSAACKRLFDRYRLLFRPAANGGSVSYAEDPALDLLALFNEPTPFSFILTSTDPWLGHYTEMDAAQSAGPPSETLFYFDNLREFREEGGQWLLHPPARAFDHGAVPVRAKQFSQTFDPPLKSAKLKISDALKGQTVWQGQTSERESRLLPVNLGQLPEGYYRLAVNRRKPSGFYLSDIPAVKQWGVVEIYAGGPAMAELPEACRVITADGKPEPKTFTLHFANRKTLWRYYLFSTAPLERSFEHCQVVGIDKRRAKSGDTGELCFSRKSEPVSLEGQQAWVFESDQSLPLWQAPAAEHGFSLKTNGRSDGGGASYPLPYAQPTNTRLDAESGVRRMCSEIFVYL